MKKIYMFITLLSAFILNAQRYQFTINNTPYTPLSDATELQLPEFWDDPEDVILSLPIQPSIFGTGPYQFGIFDGYFDFSLFSPPQTFGYLSFGGYDLIFRPGCIVRYKTEGSAPNRIFKIEFVNVGFYSDQNNSDFFNGQIWVHEDGCFSGHIGAYDMSNSQELTAGVFILSDYDSLALITGNISNPEYSEITLSELLEMPNDPLMGGVPAPNTFFQFCPLTAPTYVEAPETEFKLFPNPLKDRLFIQSNKENISQIQILSIDGKIIHYSTPEPSQLNNMDISHLKPGVYLLHITLENGARVKRKFVKQ